MTTIVKDPIKTLQFDPDKCSDLLTDLINIFRNHKPTVGEIIVAYGNLGYSLGAKIEGYNEKGPSIEELEKQYYTEPKIGIALMLQGIEVTNWFQQHKEEAEQNHKEEKEEK